MTVSTRILLGLVALLLVSGAAAAQNAPCPECDEDGAENIHNSYSSVDVGVIHDESEALADTDTAQAHEGDEKGFWTWMSICLSVFIERIENTLGLDTQVDVDANAEVYAGEEGADIDLTAAGFDFDESEVGDLDGMTWETMADANDARRENGLPERSGAGVPDGTFEGADVDVCLHAEIQLATCG